MNRTNILNGPGSQSNPVKPNCLNIHEKMFNVANKVAHIPKNGYNEYSDYKYVQASDVVSGVKKILMEERIKFKVDYLSHHREMHGKNFHTEVRSKATFINVDNPVDKYETEFMSISADTLDKDLFKAQTNGIKYLFISEFQIETDDGLVDVENASKSPVPQGHPPLLPEKQRNSINSYYKESYNKKHSYGGGKGSTQSGRGKSGQASYKQKNYINQLQMQLSMTEFNQDEIDRANSKQASDMISHLKSMFTNNGGY